MKRNRGSRLLRLLILLPLWLGAGETTYTWSVAAMKREAVQYEAFTVEYTCRFSTEAYPYVIVFEPPKETAEYRMVPQNSDEQIVDGRRVNRYRFVVFPKKAGALTLAFNAVMEHTTKASIENAVIGRDNVEKLDYTAKETALPPLSVDVAAQTTSYAGHMTLHLDVDRDNVDAYTPVQVRIRLEGYGNMDALKPFTLDIPGVRQFTDGEQKQLRLGDNGFEGNITQQFALVSERNFTVPPLHFSYFDAEQKRTVTLSTEPKTVTVRPAAAPAEQEHSLAPSAGKAAGWNASWLHLLLALTAGIIIGRFLLPVKADEEEATLAEKLRRCSDPERFVAYLAIDDAVKYRSLIDEIEAKLKAGEKIDLAPYKRRL